MVLLSPVVWAHRSAASAFCSAAATRMKETERMIGRIRRPASKGTKATNIRRMLLPTTQLAAESYAPTHVNMASDQPADAASSHRPGEEQRGARSVQSSGVESQNPTPSHFVRVGQVGLEQSTCRCSSIPWIGQLLVNSRPDELDKAARRGMPSPEW